MQDHLPFTAQTDDEPGPRAELTTPAVTVAFMLAGNAHVTFQSRRTDARFTYRIERADPRSGDTRPAPHFVSVLVGPDNGRNYKFLGTIFEGRVYAHGRRSKIDPSALSAVAFAWVWKRLSAGQMHPELAVYHEGRCGRCGRRLTTPRSIEIGLGPICEEKGFG
jgi:uncharacterized protein DUF6011